MKNFIQVGDVIEHKAASAIVSGQLVVIGKRVGVAVADIAAQAVGALRVKGVVTLPKSSGDDVAQGALLYWSAGSNHLTTTASGNTLAGYAAAPAASGATSVALHLNA